MMNAKGLAALLSICMLAALPGCCGNWGCHRKDKCADENGERHERHRREHREEKTTKNEGNGKRTYKKKSVSESEM